MLKCAPVLLQRRAISSLVGRGGCSSGGASSLIQSLIPTVVAAAAVPVVPLSRPAATKGPVSLSTSTASSSSLLSPSSLLLLRGSNAFFHPEGTRTPLILNVKMMSCPRIAKRPLLGWRFRAAATTAGTATCCPVAVRAYATAAHKDGEGDAANAEKRSKEEEKKGTDTKTESAEEKDGSKEKGADAEADAPKPRLSFWKRIREDFAKFPEVYNQLNGLHFVLFLAFCLVSTASVSEDLFWKNNLCISDRFRPLAWWTHAIVTENFMAMVYAMMLLHRSIIQMVSVWGAKRVQLFVVISAGLSGAIMWLGNWIYYRDARKRGVAAHVEYQFGPWDVIYSLLMAQWLHVSIHPLRAVVAFDHWLKYASAIGTLAIWVYDWQPTVVGTVLGLVLCKTVPAFKVVMPKK